MLVWCIACLNGIKHCQSHDLDGVSGCQPYLWWRLSTLHVGLNRHYKESVASDQIWITPLPLVERDVDRKSWLFRWSTKSFFKSLVLSLNMKFLASLAALALMVIPAKSNARPMVGDLMAEKLYYAEGRQHPGHPLHGSHEGLWAGSDGWSVCDWCGFPNHLFDESINELIDGLTYESIAEWKSFCAFVALVT